jgi:hypothetical protein
MKKGFCRNKVANGIDPCIEDINQALVCDVYQLSADANHNIGGDTLIGRID